MEFKYAILLLLWGCLMTQAYDRVYVVDNRYNTPEVSSRSNFEDPVRRPTVRAAAAQPQPQQQPQPQTRPATRNFGTQTANDVQRPQTDQQWQGNNPAETSTVSSSPPRPQPSVNYKDRFSSNLFQKIALPAVQQNVVYSPGSVHAMLCMIYGVSSGQTYAELQQAGHFGPKSRELAADFTNFLRLQPRLEHAKLIVANKVYYNPALGEPNYQFPAYAKNYFSAEVEKADMTHPRRTASNINTWASDHTGGIIKNLISAGDIDDQTQAIIVNAIYFKAHWANEFSAMDTMPAKFRLGNGGTVNVNMMFNDDVFDYAELPELDATALEMPYAGNQVSMLLILPNQVQGLAQLESRLAQEQNDLNFIAARLRRETVTVRIPKFRIEFEQDMVQPLQQMGVREMFTSNSRVDAMLTKRVQVSRILQKAFIDVNEAGSEAAAASYAKFVPLSLPIKSREFTADHPFIFAIRTPTAVLFIGHVVQPTQAT